jgi:glycosyltransferase involved in cell wall biosynthesis
MNILLSAYSCHPARGSESGIGWGWLYELSKYHQIWLLFYAGQGQTEAVEEATKRLPNRKKIHLIGLNVPRLFQKRFYRFRYEMWQIKAYIVAKKIVKANKIDLIHQVTIAAWWFSGYYYLLSRKLIWGPISGGQYIPFKAFPFLRIRDKFYEAFRALFTRILIRLSVSTQENFRKAQIVLASNESSLKLFNRFRKKKKCVLFSDTGIQKNVVKKGNSKKNSKLQLLWSGLLIPRKNFGLLLEAVKLLPGDGWELIVAGDGNLMRYWKNKVSQTKIAPQIRFLGKVPFEEMKDLYSEADIFVFPSLREASGSVILEAMTNGLPVIALELNGAKYIVEQDCGILIPVKDRIQMINDFKNAIIKLWQNNELRYEMGENGRKRVEENFIWEKRGKMMDKIYREIDHMNSGLTPQ